MGQSRELLFVPLGGVGEIGMNLSLYGLGSGRKRSWLMVDLGVSFAGEEAPGIDLVLPDIRFLEEERANIAGLVFTHAHEDHVGALLHLWPRLRVPVYATKFTAALIAAKRLSEPGAPDIPITIVPSKARFQVGPFDIELVDVAHSIPESNAIVLHTPLGRVVHTGDWKLDPTPLIGARTDEARLRELGAEGVLAVICDSTNAIRDGRSPSEADVAKTLDEIVAAAPGRVAVTTFASNVVRMRSVALAAAKAGRQVVVVGRAMERVAGVARDLGMLDGVPDFLGQDAYGYLPRDKVVALLTGSQGEPRAALARIAQDDHPEIALSKGDRLIFSSRVIPGNERAIGRIVNGLVRLGVEIITDRDALVHVSGHPRREEMAELYSWLKPKVSVPVHGEPVHLAAHARLASSLGVPDVVLAGNGDVVQLAPGAPGVIDEVPAGRLYQDGLVLVEAAAKTIPERRRLSYVGVISISIVLAQKGGLAADPMVERTGLPDRGWDGRSMDDVIADAVIETFESLPKGRRRDPDAVAESIERGVRSAVSVAWGKKPVCHVLVATV